MAFSLRTVLKGYQKAQGISSGSSSSSGMQSNYGPATPEGKHHFGGLSDFVANMFGNRR